MKPLLATVLLATGLSATVRLHAQPTQRVQDAVTQLIGAGSYTWLQTGSYDVGGRRVPQATASGATVIDGPTVAVIGNTEAVFLGNDAAFFVASGWKHVRDLAAEDFQETNRRAPRLAVVPGLRSADRATAYVYVPLHDFLRWLLKNGSPFFEHDGALASELPLEAETYFMEGRLPPARAVRPKPAAQSPHILLSVWLGNGALSKIVIESARADTRTGETRSVTRTYIIEFSQIGTTKPKIDPLAAALFPKLR